MLSPSRKAISAEFLACLEQLDHQGQLFLSVVTIHEIEKGIALLEYKGASAKAALLRGWLQGLLTRFADRILPLETQAASLAGQLEAKALAAGHDPGMADATIAGIAQAHDLLVITDNTRHFAPFGIAACTPDEALSRIMT